MTLGKPELGPFISDYEPLSYDREPVHRSHSRHKRSLSAGRRVSEDPVELSFSAHDRDFNLRLFADHSVFHPGYKVTGPLDRPVTGVEHSLYEGHLIGEPGSHVFGVVRDGVFDGTIRTRRHGTFYVERVGRYLPDLPVNSSVHSVIYHHDHLDLPFDQSWQIGAATPGCGATQDVQTWMSDIQFSSSDEEEGVAPSEGDSGDNAVA